MSLAALLDVNVLVALAWPNHIHNRTARAWFAANSGFGWATCPLTQTSFVRISSSPKIMAEAVDPVDAIALLDRITSHEHHVFWNDAISFTNPSVPGAMLVSHRQVVDAYLLGLAIHFGGKLVTFDQGIKALLQPDGVHRTALEILSAN